MPSASEQSRASEQPSSQNPDSKMTPEELLRCHKAVAEMQRDGLLESPDRKPQTRDDEILSQLD